MTSFLFALTLSLVPLAAPARGNLILEVTEAPVSDVPGAAASGLKTGVVFGGARAGLALVWRRAAGSDAAGSRWAVLRSQR